MSLPSRVLLLTRVNCTLCDEAASVVARTCEDAGVGWRAIDVDTDECLRAAYTDHVPVVFTDGELHGYWFVDADKLKQALVDRPARPMGDDWRPAEHHL
ncbi:glutaredoxin family protein [Tessaracoccus antarcticus]|uniref:Glutaredoxin family protein n=1 Tax=Tessaracoccus antarcticus TaxID=2479848 RepID=A0A3M0G7Z1_9ACTN|nr:glutaredoxin family protein [Tessaracoccus antarcticus]RMB61141.1 glutaredoxin family protein [Tessaracoccus antarcticus]